MHKASILIPTLVALGLAQVDPVAGIRSNPPRVWALTNATVVTEPGVQLETAILVIRDGRIAGVGRNIVIPADAYLLDLENTTIYPGFIESWFPVPVSPAGESTSPRAHWNRKVTPERISLDQFDPASKPVTGLRELGFTTAHLVGGNGIFRGSGSVVQLDPQATVLNPAATQVVALEFGGWGSEEYPNSLLGSIALARQTLLDAGWYAEARRIQQKYPQENEAVTENAALAALEAALEANRLFAFESRDELDVLRAGELAREFSLRYWLKGSGYEYRRAQKIAGLKACLILPLNFPTRPQVENPWEARDYSTEQLKHWDLAPDNPLRMLKIGASLALTSADLKNPQDFRTNLSRSVQRGFPEREALAALTTIPAAQLDLQDQIGKIAPGYLANLTVVEGNYFDGKAPVRAVWIGGQEFAVERKPAVDIAGEWSLDWNEQIFRLTLVRKDKRLTGNFKLDTLELKLESLSQDQDRLTWLVQTDTLGIPGITRFSGTFAADRARGQALRPDGKSEPWSAGRSNRPETETEPPAPEQASDLPVTFPEGAFGFRQLPTAEKAVLINDATIWTCGPQGVLEGYDILFVDGKVDKLAPAISYPRGGALIIDGKGKHVTPGIIDCHSHSAAASINEGTQSNTAEVRIQDVLDSDDISIYRELAGGVTTINILHGSANTIGGQNAVIKLRWGRSPRELIFSAAPPGIKFALGENVKQSNWGDKYTTRYPQTRLGVEQYLRDAFTAARDYERELAQFARNTRWRKHRVPPRRDLELEALSEVLQGKRYLHCHSYRQDEILMLMRVAEDFGFKVRTFQHILEGYKVADVMAAHGTGGSTFSDWWAYKFEVYDAIPYNGALMHAAGVTVSFNSDSDELARRLNTEAAKAVKYGGVSEAEALKFVTINPARQLGIDSRVGSLEVGKDADFVIWSDNPLSTAAVCEQTWIEGSCYFSLTMDQELRQQNEDTRNRVIQKIIGSKNNSGQPQVPDGTRDHHSGFHCLEGDAR